MVAPSPRPRRRWRLALVVALIGAATLIIAVLGMTNPWRYTVLFPLERPAVATIALVTGAVLLGVALVLGTARLARASLLGWTVALALLVAVCFGLPLFATDSVFGAHASRAQPMAVSPDGSFEVVKSTVDSLGHARTVLVVRSRTGPFGLLSREAVTPIAECDHDPFAGEIPPESVRFTSRTTIAVPVQGESTMVVAFDPITLAPTRTIRICP